MERAEQRKVVEALVLASSEPISAVRIAQIAPECTPSLAKDLVGELNTFYQEQERAFEIWEVAGGYQVRTRAEFSGYLQLLKKDRPLRLSSAALETLAIVAYKQPATRSEIEAVRGVEAGPVLKSLMERGLCKIAGHRDVPGHPMLYATTRRFLEVFGLESLKNLPALRELEDLAREHGLENPDSTVAGDAANSEANGGGEAEQFAVDSQQQATEESADGETVDDVALAEESFDEEALDEEVLNEEVTEAKLDEAGLDEEDLAEESDEEEPEETSEISDADNETLD